MRVGGARRRADPRAHTSEYDAQRRLVADTVLTSRTLLPLRLASLVAAREKAEKIEEEKRRVEKEEKERVEEEKKKKWVEEHMRVKVLVNEYKEALEERKKEEEEEERERKMIEESLRLERMEKNCERVEYRTILMGEKMRQMQHEAELKTIQEMEKLERLSALAATVPYYERLLNAKADLSKMTVARENDVYQEDLTGLSDFQHGEGKLRSFTNEKVFSDVRFRLGAALHAAGIAQSAASRAVVRQLIPRAPERTTGIGLRN